MKDDPFEYGRETTKTPPKRNKWQIKPDKHKDFKELNKDWDTINLICDLYDMGIDLKMVKSVYKDIEKERSRDYASDISDYESQVMSGLRGGPWTTYE